MKQRVALVGLGQQAQINFACILGITQSMQHHFPTKKLKIGAYSVCDAFCASSFLEQRGAGLYFARNLIFLIVKEPRHERYSIEYL